jgi:glutamate dehydrogenase/leucine dehydrogenase
MSATTTATDHKEWMAPSTTPRVEQRGTLLITGPAHKGVFDVYEASNDADGIYSCIAICRENWRSDWSALGGTRRIQADGEMAKAKARETAIELAHAMYLKNMILRKAEQFLVPARSRQLFNWQGGKGVILTPSNDELTPRRLICHGRLIESLQGEYIGSKDAGVGTAELKWIACATRYLIGLGCGRDTGEATAHGVLSGLETALPRTLGKNSLEGIQVLVCGAGKVGYPLLGLLHAAGAIVYVYDPALLPVQEKVRRWCEDHDDPGASVNDREMRKEALFTLLSRKRILSSEASALSLAGIEIVSPSGGATGWLAKAVSGGPTRVETLAKNRYLRLVLGAGNDQLPSTDSGTYERDKILSRLTDAGILFVPDPLVSPGGVIAVSHELNTKWDADNVNRDARDVVKASVEQVFTEAERYGALDSRSIYRAFTRLTEEIDIAVPRVGNGDR